MDTTKEALTPSPGTPGEGRGEGDSVPRALAIETSARVGSVATVGDGRVLVEEQFPHGLQYAAQIVPILDRLTRAQGWKPNDLDELYISAGPGSFTGLRIGITLAK